MLLLTTKPDFTVLIPLMCFFASTVVWLSFIVRGASNLANQHGSSWFGKRATAAQKLQKGINRSLQKHNNWSLLLRLSMQGWKLVVEQLQFPRLEPAIVSYLLKIMKYAVFNSKVYFLQTLKSINKSIFCKAVTPFKTISIKSKARA